MTKKELFSLLIELDFKKTDYDKHTLFKNGKELIVFPKGKLSERHYLSTLTQLYMNGRIKEKKFKKMIKN